MAGRAGSVMASRISAAAGRCRTTVGSKQSLVRFSTKSPTGTVVPPAATVVPPPPPPAGFPAKPFARRQGYESLERLPNNTKTRNFSVGGGLAALVAGVFFYTIYQMSNTDELDEVIKEMEDEAKVNLHKSGLKIDAAEEQAKATAERIQTIPAEGKAKAKAAAERAHTQNISAEEKAKEAAEHNRKGLQPKIASEPTHTMSAEERIRAKVAAEHTNNISAAEKAKEAAEHNAKGLNVN